jgi:hypothetical protein
MSFPAKVVYPLPPPTTNSLTSMQRAQLLRSTNKLGRILGTTPLLIDTSITTLGKRHPTARRKLFLTGIPAPLCIQLPFNDMDDSTSSEESAGSSSSCSSAISTTYPYDLPRLSKSISGRSTLTRSGSLRSRKSTESMTSSESWPSHNKRPTLRLATPSPLETIPASPFAGWTSSGSVSPHSRSSSHSIEGHEFTIRPHTNLSEAAHDSPTAPSFTIPSPNSDRRHKMERLRRKLGANVPTDLVFPSSYAAEDVNVFSPVLLEKAVPIPLITPTSRKASRITATRDSVASASPHHAPRKAVAHKDSPLPPLPVTGSDNIQPRREERRRVKGHHHVRTSLDMGETTAKFRVIVKSPTEHGSSCSEEFGITRHPTALQSEWYMSDEEEDEVKYWSTRRGYHGWEERLGTGKRSYGRRSNTS